MVLFHEEFSLLINEKSCLALTPRKCPLCGLSNSITLFKDINRREGLPVAATLVKCRECGMNYLNEAPEAHVLMQLYQDGFVDRVLTDPEQVEPVPRTGEETSYLNPLSRINGLLRGHPHDWPDNGDKNSSIFDFGCYTGDKLMRWYQRGWQIGGIDLNRQAIEVARRRFPEGKFWCGDLLSLHIPDRFDFIRADNVIEHLPDPVAYLKVLLNLLKPNGWLRVFVPNGVALSTRLIGRYSTMYWVPFHVNLFSPKTLERALNASGLVNIQCKSFTPIGSWTWTQRQMILRPGFNRRPCTWLDRIIRSLSLLNYPGETLTQWLGVGEELIGTAQKRE
jgi:2-polyprenyl-3-methyl-5-hydroxy-6-metoxy-1,4-benzoquinol methylase